MRRLTKRALATSLYAAGRTVEEIACALESKPEYIAACLRAEEALRDAGKWPLPILKVLTEEQWEAMKDALEFYANEENYRRYIHGRSVADHDNGERARQALEGLGQ